MKLTNDSSLVADRSQMAKSSSPTLRWSGQYRVLVVYLRLPAAAHLHRCTAFATGFDQSLEMIDFRKLMY
jgi:hypothetical protein